MLYPSLLTTMVLVLHVGARTPKCDPKGLAQYRMHFSTMWSREIYPKQYPEYRPPAQWTKVIGRSHNTSYNLFSVGKPISSALKSFVEGGDSNLLDQETQGGGGVFDEFNAPPITRGEGGSGAEFFIDGSHSKVSLAAKIVPSPDWFVGVDSFDLCVGGAWMESVTLEVDPLDGGSDNGFTFTSPNWPTIPQQPVTRISSQKPNHPANSFHYPDRPHHPPLATFRLTKISEYQLTSDSSSSASSSSASSSSASSSSASSSSATSSSVLKSSNVQKDAVPVTPLVRQRPKASRRYQPPAVETNEVTSGLKQSSPASRSSKSSLLNSVMNKVNRRKFKKNRKWRRRNLRRRRDCVVTEWSEWSPCSKTCGIGEQQRKREIRSHAKRRGRPCPILSETKWCGSARDCVDHKYFEW